MVGAQADVFLVRLRAHRAGPDIGLRFSLHRLTGGLTFTQELVGHLAGLVLAARDRRADLAFRACPRGDQARLPRGLRAGSPSTIIGLRLIWSSFRHRCPRAHDA